MQLNHYLNTLDFTKELVHVKDLLASAEATVSFWGTRVINLPNYEGRISLDELVRKVYAAAIQREKANDMTVEERLAGIDIVYKLRDFYTSTDEKIRTANLFTSLINNYQEFNIGPYTNRFYTETNWIDCHFRAYNEEEFKKEFGQEKDGNFYKNSDGEAPNSNKVYASEGAIRAKFYTYQEEELTDQNQELIEEELIEET